MLYKYILRCLIPLSICAFSLNLKAQTCEQILTDAQKAANSGAYKDAVLKYLAAQKVCPTTRDQEIKGYVLAVFTKIEALKSKAENAEKAAKIALQKAKDAEAKALAEQNKTETALKEVQLAKKQAETNLLKAQEAEALAVSEQTKTKKALDDALNANVRVVVSYLRDIDQHILKLDYDAAFEKCQTAWGLNVESQKDTLQKRILEIAYFYTETDTSEAALKTLNLLKPTSFSGNKDEMRRKLQSEIRNLCPPQYFNALNERYYPKMIFVEGISKSNN